MLRFWTRPSTTIQSQDEITKEMENTIKKLKEDISAIDKVLESSQEYKEPKQQYKNEEAPLTTDASRWMSRGS